MTYVFQSNNNDGIAEENSNSIVIVLPYREGCSLTEYFRGHQNHLLSSFASTLDFNEHYLICSLDFIH